MSIHSAEVISTREISPSMIRVTLGGPDLATFTSTDVPDEYLRVFLPHSEDRSKINLPKPAGDRGWEFPEGVTPAPLRTYTVRAWRPDIPEVDIDFVVHDHGVAADWVRAAQPGDVVGLNSPTGLYAPPEDVEWQFLVTDQTGLPAVSRLLEQEPTVRTKVVVEVPDDDHRQPLPDVANAEVTWITGGNGTGPSRLAEVVQSAPNPSEGARGYIWVAGETRCLRDVRKYLRHTLKLSADHYKVVGYWTEGAEEWRDRYLALPEETRESLMALWAEDRDQEEIEDTYVERLEKLGL